MPPKRWDHNPGTCSHTELYLNREIKLIIPTKHKNYVKFLGSEGYISRPRKHFNQVSQVSSSSTDMMIILF
jgi:hypothetical protein